VSVACTPVVPAFCATNSSAWRDLTGLVVAANVKRAAAPGAHDRIGRLADARADESYGDHRIAGIRGPARCAHDRLRARPRRGEQRARREAVLMKAIERSRERGSRLVRREHRREGVTPGSKSLPAVGPARQTGGVNE
jgi:hypothetical protein